MGPTSGVVAARESKNHIGCALLSQRPATGRDKLLRRVIPTSTTTNETGLRTSRRGSPAIALTMAAMAHRERSRGVK